MPARLTLQVSIRGLDVPSEWVARVDARSLVRPELERAGFPEPDTVVVAAVKPRDQ
jgi:hypothetical protein